MGQDKDNIASQHLEAINNVVVKLDTHNWLLITLVVLLSIIVLVIVLKKVYEALQKSARKQLARELTLSRVNVTNPAN